MLYSDNIKGDEMSVHARILHGVRAHGRGWVFSPADFASVGDRAAIDQALSRLTRKDTIRRLARGLYHYPRVSQRLGPISPSPDVVAHAVARKTGSKLQIAGAQAANALGLSTQVPAHAVYFTDGPSRRVMIGKSVVTLRRASPKSLVAAGTTAGTVVQALRYLGKDTAPKVADVVAGQLSIADQHRLMRDSALAPGWMRPVLNKIVRAGSAAAV
jgi:Family of unknown function (DUF6088)